MGMLVSPKSNEKGRSMVKQAVLDGAQERAVTRQGERVAEEILRMLDRPAYKFRGAIRGAVSIVRSRKGVEVKVTKDLLMEVRLVAKKNRLTNRSNIQILAERLMEDAALFAVLIQTF